MMEKVVESNIPVASGFAARSYKYKILIIFFLSISSGLPFLLLLSTLSVWLIESGISKTEIGLFAWATFPYTLKFLIAPLIESLRVPFITKTFGFRRGWILLSQIGLILSLIILGKSNPSTGLAITKISALLVGSFAALQDIMVEAYRIEILDDKDLGIGSSSSVVGYRVGMLISGAGAIYLSSFASWNFAYNFMAMCVGVGMITTLFSFEPNNIKPHKLKISNKSALNTIKEFLCNYFIQPIKHFTRDHNIFLVLLFLLFFKAADTVLNVMTMPFLIEIGFTKLEIANVAKTFGIITMIFGSLFAGKYLLSNNLHKLLILCASMQLVASLLFILQAFVGNNIVMLFVTMGIENITCGMSQVAIVSYLSRLCNLSYTAIHYALLSSLASFLRILVSSGSGYLADSLSWTKFYFIVTVLCIPTILILLYCKEFFQNLHFINKK